MLVIIIPLLPQPLLREQCPAHGACCKSTQAFVNLGPATRLLRQICEFDFRSAKAWAVQWIGAWPGSRRQTRPIRFSISGSEIKKDKRICQLAIKQTLQSCLEVNFRQQWAKAICREEFREAAIWRRVRGKLTGIAESPVVSVSDIVSHSDGRTKSYRLFFFWCLSRTDPSILAQASAIISFSAWLDPIFIPAISRRQL